MMKFLNQLAMTSALAICLSATAAAAQQGTTTRNTRQPKPKVQPAPDRNERIGAVKREGLKKTLPARERHVFALSLRGHGDSSRPASGYTPRAFAADVAAFLDAQKIPRAVIVGHSMGSAVAQRFAIDYPTRTQMLVLAGSFTTVRGHAGVQEFWDTTVAKLRDPIDPQIARGFQESTIHQPLPPGFLDLAVNESLKVPARVWRAAFAGLMQADHRAELKRINAPTLIVWGEKETYFLRPDQDALIAAIKGSRLVIWPDAGHALHWEHPQRFANELINFIEKGE
jgi:pimeloyl-ACP methyl ester carboxylesterase